MTPACMGVLFPCVWCKRQPLLSQPQSSQHPSAAAALLSQSTPPPPSSLILHMHAGFPSRGYICSSPPLNSTCPENVCVSVLTFHKDAWNSNTLISRRLRKHGSASALGELAAGPSPLRHQGRPVPHLFTHSQVAACIWPRGEEEGITSSEIHPSKLERQPSWKGRGTFCGCWLGNWDRPRLTDRWDLNVPVAHVHLGESFQFIPSPIGSSLVGMNSGKKKLLLVATRGRQSW